MKNENKTKPTYQDIIESIASLSEKRQSDTEELIQIMQNISSEPPVLWSDRIIGFGKYHYKYPSGREGNWM